MRVHDSQAYRKMDVTRKHISRISELREILLSFQNGFNLVNTAAVRAILESSSGLAKTILQSTVKGGRRQGRQRKRWEENIRKWTGLEPSSVITEPRCLKFVTVSAIL